MSSLTNVGSAFRRASEHDVDGQRDSRSIPLRAAILAGLLVAYWAAAQLGLAVHSPGQAVAPLWPAAGILSGGLAVVPPKDRPVLFVGVFAILFGINYYNGSSAPVSLILASANCLEGAVFLAIYRLARWPLALDSVHQFGCFVLAAAIACAVSGLIGIASLSIAIGSDLAEVRNWLLWFMADFVGIIVTAPPLLAFRTALQDRSAPFEPLLVLSVGVLTSVLLFLGPKNANPNSMIPVSLIFPILFWGGVRCSTFVNALLSLLVSLIVFYSLAHDLGPFSSIGWPLPRKLLVIQNFSLTACGASLLLSVLFSERRQREALLAAALEAQRTLLFEVNHRVKNSLQLVTSILAIEAAKLKDPAARAALKTAQSRIDIIASLHRRLYSNEQHAVVDLSEVALETAQSVIRTGGRKDVGLEAAVQPGILVDVAVAVPVSLAIGEIVTNAVKHAYPEGAGSIYLELTEGGGQIDLSIRDQGSGFPAATAGERSGGIGTRLIADLFKQVDAVMNVDSTDGGVRYTVHVPGPTRSAAAEQ